jgi:hypothetical protein
MRGTLRLAFAAAVALAPATARGQVCNDTRNLVTAAMPAGVGDPTALQALLQPTVGPQLGELFDRKRAQKLLGDKLKPGEGCKKRRGTELPRECEATSRRGSSLTIDLERGRVSYLNLERSSNKEATQIPDAQALDLARRTATALGVPAAEMTGTPDLQYLRIAVRSTNPLDTSGMSFRAETHVRFQRTIGSVPVAFSRLQIAVDARGEVARAHLRWPDFRMLPGVAVDQGIPRATLISEVVDQIDAGLRCGTLGNVLAQVVYARADLVDGSDGQDSSLGGPDTTPEETEAGGAPHFVPALLVSVIPVEQAEDSGIPQMPVENHVFSLVRSAEL